MLIESLGEKQAAKAVLDAIEKNLSERRALTYDLGGKAGTSDVGDAIAEMIKEEI
jgi:3-isopropylmalate dehydrogenase